MIKSRTPFNLFIFITFIINILLIHGIPSSQNTKCDDTFINIHMLKCYQEHIDKTMDVTSPESAYFMDGFLLCQAYNSSSSYRQCVYSIFNRNGICSFAQYPYSYQYLKIYWKLVMSSCHMKSNEQCSPSPLSQQIINKCHYTFDDSYPTKCKEFLRSLKCLERYEKDLIPATYGSSCSRNKAYYYYYGDVAARLQLSINICESDVTPLNKY